MHVYKLFASYNCSVMCLRGSDTMCVISVRTTEEERNMIKTYAEFFGMTLSEFVKTSAIEKIEDLLDLQAIEEYEKSIKQGNNKIVAHDDILSEVGLKWPLN